MITSDSNLNKADKVSDIATQREKISRRGAWAIAKDLPASFKYAAQGLGYAFLSQRNFRIHIVIGLLVSIFAVWLELPIHDVAILVITIATVLVLELINTSIEAVVDLAIGRRFHPLARIAKDCAAASVLVASVASFVIALLLIAPSFLKRIGF
ncbi:diacylglycerol kinase family protein [Prochlorococcus marinus]|uniref:diacylglycerol kinase family protein n=1 Tax=Prochlorococcus marinus TaxID=1219 RepID=UPI0022B46C5A|nr:diacylglycerol kinase family protein [Prochlorococcus marinus]